MSPPPGFPVVICVVCYGPHTDLASTFLSGLYNNTDPVLFTLRAGLNEVAPATLALFEDHAARHGNVELFIEPKNIFKDPLMRRMFTERPIASPWIIWFDDDSRPTRPDWLPRLWSKMQAFPDVAQWGPIFVARRPVEGVRPFIENSPWYRGLPLQSATGQGGKEEIEFRFATGGFWAMRNDVIRSLDWPDPRIIHAGEDYLLGEALRQNGWKIGNFNHGVAVNDAERRNAGAPEVERLPGVPLDGA